MNNAAHIDEFRASILTQLYALRTMLKRKRIHMLRKGYQPSEAFTRASFRNLLDAVNLIRKNVDNNL